MIKIPFTCCLLGLLVSCTGSYNQKVSDDTTVVRVDTNVVSVEEEPEPLIVAEEIIPATADESFADFFYNFASDEAFQKSRIVIPLSYYEGSQVKRYTREGWPFDPLFSREGVYTTLFDTEEDMELEKDTSAHSVQVDWMRLDTRSMKRYYFERKQDCWYLEAVNVSSIPPLEEKMKNKEDFFEFYRQFVEDSVFQRERLNDPLLFVTADPDDEFQIIETTLDLGQWFAFRPPMSLNSLTNIRYGQKDMPGSPVKIVEFKGFGNGFSNVLHFRRRHGIWKLVKFEDLSD